jgi:hypothetical protein
MLERTGDEKSIFGAGIWRAHLSRHLLSTMGPGTVGAIIGITPMVAGDGFSIQSSVLSSFRNRVEQLCYS